MARIPINDQVKILEDRYKDLERFIFKKIFSITKYNELRVREIKKSIDRELLRVTKFSLRWAERYIKETARISARDTIKKLKQLGKEAVNPIGKTLTVGDQYVDLFMKNIIRANKSISENVGKYFSIYEDVDHRVKVEIQNKYSEEEFNAGIDRIIEAGTTERFVHGIGFSMKSRIEVTKEIKDYFIKTFGDIDFVEIMGKDGIPRKYNLSKYSKMVARTRMRQAQTAAMIERANQYGNDLVQVSRHADSCPICEPYQGKIYSLNGLTPGYPVLNIEIPIHPNCEHNLDPVSLESIAIEKKRGTYTPQTKDAPTVEETRDDLKKVS